jgi:hypothetical protein
MEVKLDFETVRERWLAAGGKDTGGIIGWFAPPVVEHWVESEILRTRSPSFGSSAPKVGVDGPPSLTAATGSATFEV